MKYNGQIIQGIFPLVSGIQYNKGDMFISGGQLHVFTQDWKFSGRLDDYVDSEGYPINSLKLCSESYITAHRYNPNTNQRGVESLITNKTVEYLMRSIFDDRSDTPIYVKDEAELMSSILDIDHSGIWYYVIGDNTADDQHKFYVKTYKSKSLDEYYSNIIFADIIRFDLKFRLAGKLNESLFAVDTGKYKMTELVNLETAVFGKINSLLKEYNNRVARFNKINKVVSSVDSGDGYYTSDGLHVIYKLNDKVDSSNNIIDPIKFHIEISEYNDEEDTDIVVTSRDISYKEIYDDNSRVSTQVKTEVGELTPNKFKYLISIQKVSNNIEAIINTETDYTSKFKAKIVVEYEL